MMKKLLSRKEIKQEDQWNLTSIFNSETEFEQLLNVFLNQEPEKRWEKLRSFGDQWMQNATSVKELLQAVNELDEKLEKLYTYAHLKHDEDLNNDIWKNIFQKVTFLYQDFFQNTAWIEPELLAIDEKLLKQHIDDPILIEFEFYFKTLLNKKAHTLSADKEQLLSYTALPMSTAQKTFSLLNNVDLKFEPATASDNSSHELTHGSYRAFQRSFDRKLRQTSFVNMHKGFKGFENTFSELLMGHVQQHIFDVKTRGYKNSLMAALHPKNISNDVYHNLISTVRENISPLHDYIKLRKEILELDTIHLYDLQIPPIQEEADYIEFDKAVDWVVESVAPLGEEYQSILEKGLKHDGWVDRYENQNKRSGAYSSGCYKSFPYILMNYKGNIYDVLTLAHEAGHSMHTYLSHQNQPYQYSRYPIFVAEVASTFNESLFIHYLLNKDASEKAQLLLLHERLEELRATLFRQTMFAEFELFMHESLEHNIPLTASSINEHYLKLNQDYYGPHISLDPEVAIEWARVPHFYSNFYVYQYATGISAALTLADKVLNKEPQSKEHYLNFLKQGGHSYPIDLLKTAGVDMAQKEPIKLALDNFQGLVSHLRSIYDKTSKNSLEAS